MCSCLRFAITDHDTVAGIEDAEACAKAQSIAFLPGVELSAGGKAEVHVLGYGVSAAQTRLCDFLSDMQNERQERAARILEKLSQLNMPLSMEEISDSVNSALGRPLIARAMVARGYVNTVQQAFDQYLNSGRPAYVARRKLDVTDAIALLRDVGAVPVLAHPSLIRMTDADLKSVIHDWLNAGLQGVEIYHPAMTQYDRMYWLSFARNNDLLVTGAAIFMPSAINMQI